MRARPPGGVEESGPAVAQRHVAEVGELGLIGDAPDEGILGEMLPLCVAEREPGELLGSGKTGGAVAPARPVRAVPVRDTAVVFGAGDRAWPPGVWGFAAAPVVQPSAYPPHRLGVAVDDDASAHRRREQRQGASDAVRYAEVSVSAPPVGAGSGWSVKRPPSRQSVWAWFGQPDEVG